MADKTTYLVPGFHSDVVWLEDQRDYAVSLMGDMGQNLQICRADPHYGVFLHELTYVKPYLDVHPEERDEVKRWIAEGRIGLGGSHSQPTEAVISGEGLIRNILYGRLYHEGQLGDRPRIYMPWDVFGHCAQLAQILAKSRFDGCIWSKNIRGAQPVFWHVALDGTRLLFKRMDYGFPAWREEEFLEAIEACFAEIASLGLSTDCRLDATDFKPPSSWFAGRCGELRERAGHAVVVSGKGHEMWLDRTLDDVLEGRALLPVTARDFEWHHQGTAVSRIEFKIANRLAENLIVEAEKLATFAWLLGAKYPDVALDKAWRQVLFGQHHDGITGPCCDRSYLDLMLGYREALELAHEVVERSAVGIASAVDARPLDPEAVPVVVLNSLNWSRIEPVRARVAFDAPVESVEVVGPEGAVPAQVLSSGGRGELDLLFIASGVPGVGYSTYEVRPSAGATPRERPVPGTTIENEYFQVTADPTHGGLTSIYDKIEGREVLNTVAGFGNELVALAEKPDRGEPAWECYTTGPKRFSREYNAKVTAYEGPARKRLVIRGEMKDSGREQIVTLHEGVARIDFETRITNYRGEHDLFVVTFPVDVRGAEPVFEDRFGATTKRRSRGKLDFRFHQWRNYSDCGARRCYQWIDLSGCARVRLGDGRGVTFGMTNIVTSHAPEAVEAAYTLQDALIRCGVPVTPSYDDCDWPRRSALPHEDGLMPRPDDFNADLNLGTSFRIAIRLGDDNTYVNDVLAQLDDAVQRRLEERVAARGAAVLLTYDREMPSDWPPLPVLIVVAGEAEALARLVAGLAADLEDGSLDIAPEACAVEGLPDLDDYGVALLNTGNCLASVENDDTLVLFLMHTAAWGGTPWGKDRLDWFLVPEHKTHTFHYSLVPHHGDWREAGIARAGYEFNNPLRGVATEPSAGPLPPAGHLLEVGGGVILSALKPRGNPTAALSAGIHDPADGIIVRVYEPEGVATTATIRAPWPAVRAERTNLLEEPSGDDLGEAHGYVELPVAGFGVETAAVVLERPDCVPLDGVVLGREREVAEVIHFRHWDHNAGAEPLGYSPVAIALSGEVKRGIHIRQGGVTVNTVRVSVANNLTDAPISGSVELVAPTGWHTVPSSIRYELGPGEHLSAPVLVCFDEGRRDAGDRRGLLKARTEYGGAVYQDVLDVGGPTDLDWHVHRRSDCVLLELSNHATDAIEGQAFLVTPLELFGDCAAPYALGCAGPREQYFALDPGQRIVLTFRGEEWAPGVIRSGWGVVKIAYNGRVFYKPV